jgi:DNA-binding XRE family transcriptional regulator
MPNQFGYGNNKASKLTGEQVIEIRERYATERGLSQPMLAREYDVSKNTISNILNGTTWRHLLRGAAAQVQRPPLYAKS